MQLTKCTEPVECMPIIASGIALEQQRVRLSVATLRFIATLRFNVLPKGGHGASLLAGGVL